MLVACAAALTFGQFTAGPTLAANALKGKPPLKKCDAGGYKHGKCVIVLAKGTNSFLVPTTTVRLRVTGSASTKKSQVTVWPVKVSHSPKGMQTFKVFLKGHILPLKLTKPGKIYRYNVSTGKWIRVNGISKTGIYGVVYGK